MFRPFQILTMIAVFAAAPLFAQDEGAAPETDQQLTPLERWKRLDPEQQERMRGRFDRWQNLSDEERDILEKARKKMMR